jgi:hypothetical protein
LPRNCYLVELSSLGIPASNNEHAALRINDLQVFNGKIYIGYGDAVVNTGPTDIIAFDLNNGDFITEFTVDEEGIYTYKVIDGTLMIPGIDATEDWHFGNLYLLQDGQWTKHRTIPHGIHVNDLAYFNERLYASTGTFGSIGDEVEHYFGALFASSDQGVSWDLAYATPSDDRSIFRITSLIEYNRALYAFPFAYSDMTKASIPERFHAGLSDKPYTQDKYLILLDDVFGVNDVIVFDGERWRTADILPIEHLCYTTKPFVFDEKLVVPVLSGEYIDYLHTKKHLISQAAQGLYVFDGVRTKKNKLGFDRLIDAIVKPEHLFLLIQKDDLCYIVQTDDLEKWTYHALPPVIDDPRSVEYIDNTFFIGTESGNLFVSQEIKPVKRFAEVEYCVPDEIFAEAELPRDGLYYWIAITDWHKLTDIGKVHARVKYGNIIKITTDNVKRFSLFPPTYYLDPLHETTVIINDNVVYEGIIENTTELVCTETVPDGAETWKVAHGDRSMTTYTYDKRALGFSTIPLTRKDENATVSTWKASVLRWATNTDGAIIPQTSVRQDIDHDTFYLEDLYDTHYRDLLCTFQAYGKDIIHMIAYNMDEPEDRRVSISGFTITYKDGDRGKMITAHTLKPEKLYTITTSQYLAEQAEKYLGKAINYTLTEHDVYDAFIKWFAHFRTVEQVEPRIVQDAPVPKME